MKSVTPSVARGLLLPTADEQQMPRYARPDNPKARLGQGQEVGRSSLPLANPEAVTVYSVRA